MKKEEFYYERWFLKVFCGLLTVFTLAVAAQVLFETLTKITEENFWFDLICITVVFFGISIYFRCTKGHKWFTRKGSFWSENSILFLRKGRKIYELKDVKVLFGSTFSFFGYAKTGMLKIDWGHKTLTLMAPSTKPVNSFSECELLHLFSAVLENNPNLSKDEALEFCYQSPKRKD